MRKRGRERERDVLLLMVVTLDVSHFEISALKDPLPKNTLFKLVTRLTSQSPMTPFTPPLPHPGLSDEAAKLGQLPSGVSFTQAFTAFCRLVTFAGVQNASTVVLLAICNSIATQIHKEWKVFMIPDAALVLLFCFALRWSFPLLLLEMILENIVTSGTCINDVS